LDKASNFIWSMFKTKRECAFCQLLMKSTMLNIPSSRSK
jgi:hypothetical protein